MKTIQFFKFLSLMVVLITGISCSRDDDPVIQPWYPSVNGNGEPMSAVFESRVPCSDCERTKVALVIYKNVQTGAPTTYVLSRIYVGNGDDRFVSQGTMSVTQGTITDPSAMVYELAGDAPAEFSLFWKIDDHLLLILDETRKPKVGDASHGYILNRTL